MPAMVVGLIAAIPEIIGQALQWTINLADLGFRNGSRENYFQSDDTQIALAGGLLIFVIIGGLVLFLLSVALRISLFFALPLIAEHKLGAVDAMKLSAQAAWANVGDLILLFLLEIVVALIGLLALSRAGAVVSDLYVDPISMRRMWATSRTVSGGRVFRSDDGGATWTDRTAGLPALPINAVEVDPTNSNRVWVAADLGVYQSLDGGASWANFSNALPNAYIGDLVFHPHARVLRAGTRNRGVWEIPVDGWMTQPICGVQWQGTLSPNASNRWFTFNWPATWHVLWTVMPVTPRPGAPQISWTVQVERASSEYVTYWITVRNLTPDPVTFEGRYCILSRY